MDELNELWGSIEGVGNDLYGWATGLFSGYGNAQGSKDPYIMNGGLDASDIAEIDNGGVMAGADVSKVGTKNPGQVASSNPSRSVMNAIGAALGMATGMGRGSRGSQAHAASSAFHPSVGSANPNQVFQSAVNDIKDTSNPLNVFKALNNEF